MVCENIFTPPPALMIKDGAFSFKIDYITFCSENLNLEWHINCITGSKVTAILLNRWILSIGGVALERVCVQPAKQACLMNNTAPNRTALYYTELNCPVLHCNSMIYTAVQDSAVQCIALH